MSKQKYQNLETAIFANGCFWCTEAVFQRFEGVSEVFPGFTGGHIKNPPYREVCTERTGHAEAVQVLFDPSKIAYEALLEVFFATHDPTTLNRQGNDVGTRYRSEIFYTSAAQKDASEKFISFLEKQRIFDTPIVTAISEARPFYKAEEVHHNYYNANTEQPYCQLVIDPKIKKIQKYHANKLKSVSQ